MSDNTDTSSLAAKEQGFEVIYETVHGSQAFGLAGPDSDLDIKGIIIGPADWYHGFAEAPEQLVQIYAATSEKAAWMRKLPDALLSAGRCCRRSSTRHLKNRHYQNFHQTKTPAQSG